jgi:metal-dependent amidase/aminoacylase/carboxypeptidase family protein
MPFALAATAVIGAGDKGAAAVTAVRQAELAASVTAAMETAMHVKIDCGPSMAFEDFVFLLEKIPGAFIWPGGRDEHKTFNDDE